MSNQQTNNPGGACGCISLICSVVFVLCLFTPPLFGFMVISSGLLWIIAIVSDPKKMFNNAYVKILVQLFHINNSKELVKLRQKLKCIRNNFQHCINRHFLIL